MVAAYVAEDGLPPRKAGRLNIDELTSVVERVRRFTTAYSARSVLSVLRQSDQWKDVTIDQVRRAVSALNVTSKTAKDTSANVPPPARAIGVSSQRGNLATMGQGDYCNAVWASCGRRGHDSEQAVLLDSDPGESVTDGRILAPAPQLLAQEQLAMLTHRHTQQLAMQAETYNRLQYFANPLIPASQQVAPPYHLKPQVPAQSSLTPLHFQPQIPGTWPCPAPHHVAPIRPTPCYFTPSIPTTLHPKTPTGATSSPPLKLLLRHAPPRAVVSKPYHVARAPLKNGCRVTSQGAFCPSRVQGQVRCSKGLSLDRLIQATAQRVVKGSVQHGDSGRRSSGQVFAATSSRTWNRKAGCSRNSGRAHFLASPKKGHELSLRSLAKRHLLHLK